MKPRKSLRFFFPNALALICFAFAAGSAHAASASWTGGGADALWSNTANWSASPVPGTGDTATFNAPAGAGGTVIDLGAGVTVNTVSFVGVGTPSTLPAYTIGAGAVNSQSLTLNGSGNAGLAASGTATTSQITVNAAITVNNTQQWLLGQGANPWIINGTVTPNGAAASTIQVKINSHGCIFNGLLADQPGGAKLQMSGSNAQTATLTNSGSTFTGGLFFDNGIVSVNSISMIGSPSAAGAGGTLDFGTSFGGGTLVYSGTGDTTDRVVNMAHGFNGPTITQSGASGLLKFTADVTSVGTSSIGSPTLTLAGSAAGTGEFAGKIVDNGTAGTTLVKTGGNAVTSLTLNSVDGILVGANVSGTGIAAGTTVTTVTPGTKIIGLSAATTANVAQGATITVDGVVNITRVAKSGTGIWTLSGANTFTGPVTVGGGVGSALAVSSIDNVANPNPLGQSSAAAANLLLANNATLKYTGPAASTDRGFTINGTTSGNQAFLDASGAGPINFTNTASPAYGTVDQARVLILTGTNTGDNTLAANIANNGTVAVNVTKQGLGTWVLTGASSNSGPISVTAGSLVTSGTNSSAGGTTINGGTLQLNNATNGGLASGTLTLTAGTLQALNADRTLTNNVSHTSATVSGSQSITFTSGTLTGLAGADRTLTCNLPAGKLLTLKNVALNSGAVQRVLFINGTGDTTVAGSVTSGNGFLTNVLQKGGAGTLTLSGTNSFGGNLNINGGTLKLSGNPNGLGFGGPQNTATGTTSVFSGFTLDLNGATGISEPIILSGTGIGGNGALINTGSAVTIGNGIAGLAIGASSTGSAYSTAPTVTISGTGSGATATATLGVKVASFTAGATGDKVYSVAPTVTISGGGGVGATATAVLTAGQVTGITIVNPGTGFTSAPTLALSSGTVTSGTTDTAFTGNATNFTVSGVAMTAAGSGYTGTPTYTFGSGDATPGAATLSSVTLNADSSIGGSGDITVNAVVSESGGARALSKVGANTLTLTGANTYTGATTVSQGTLALFGGSQVSAITVNSSASLGFTLGSPTTSTSSVDLTTGTVKITGAVDNASDYLLMTASTITGTPTLNSAIPNYTLQKATGDTQLKLVYTPSGSPYGTWSGGPAADIDTNGDGVKNGVAWVLGAANPGTNANGLVPTLDNTSDPNFLIFNYRRSDIAAADANTTIKVQYGSDLIGWTDALPSADIVITPSNDFYAAGIDKVEVKIRRTLAAGGKLFTRLNVVVAP